MSAYAPSLDTDIKQVTVCLVPICLCSIPFNTISGVLDAHMCTSLYAYINWVLRFMDITFLVSNIISQASWMAVYTNKLIYQIWLIIAETDTMRSLTDLLTYPHHAVQAPPNHPVWFPHPPPLLISLTPEAHLSPQSLPTHPHLCRQHNKNNHRIKKLIRTQSTQSLRPLPQWNLECIQPMTPTLVIQGPPQEVTIVNIWPDLAKTNYANKQKSSSNLLAPSSRKQKKADIAAKPPPGNSIRYTHSPIHFPC